MKGNRWFELDNPTLGQGHESYWGFQSEPNKYDLEKIKKYEAEQDAKNILMNSGQGRVEASDYIDLAPMTDEEFDALKNEILNSPEMMGRAKTEEEKKLYLRKIYGL